MERLSHVVQNGLVGSGVELLPQPVFGLFDRVWCDVEQGGYFLCRKVGFEVGAEAQVVIGQRRVP